MAGDDRGDGDVPRWMIAAAKLFGMTEVQARWKLARLLRSLRGDDKAEERAPVSRRISEVCPSCGALVGRGEAKCGRCGKPMPAGLGHFLRKAGFAPPAFLTVSSALGVALIAVHLRMMIANPKDGYLGWDPSVLVRHGALFEPAVLAQPFRLGTYAFLHIGLLHLGFNLVALTQIGPAIEELFGRGRMLFIFVVTGIFAGGVSLLLHDFAFTAGASGSLMGLIGAAAGWGHRASTLASKAMRNDMLKWAAYVMLFGLLVGADHAAHAGGFVCGGLFGLALDPEGLKASAHRTAAALMGLVGTVIALALFALALFPPAASHALADAMLRPASHQPALEELLRAP